MHKKPMSAPANTKKCNRCLREVEIAKFFKNKKERRCCEKCRNFTRNYQQRVKEKKTGIKNRRNSSRLDKYAEHIVRDGPYDEFRCLLCSPVRHPKKLTIQYAEKMLMDHHFRSRHEKIYLKANGFPAREKISNFNKFRQLD
jgi:hypothetical protein